MRALKNKEPKSPPVDQPPHKPLAPAILVKQKENPGSAPTLTPGMLPAWALHAPYTRSTKLLTSNPAAKSAAKPAPSSGAQMSAAPSTTQAKPAHKPSAPPSEETPVLPGSMRSVAESVSWPAMPSNGTHRQLALQFQFEQTQWWSQERIREHQFHQLGLLLRHAGSTVPFYRTLFKRIGFDPKQPLRPDDWNRLPILERRDLQESFAALNSTAIPASHEPTFTVSSSGSTGMAIATVKTNLQQLLWQVIVLRDHFWHRRDFAARMASIRIPTKLDEALYPEGARNAVWAVSASVYRTGPSYLLNVKANVHQQVEWLQRIAPQYLQSLPSNLEALAHCCLDHGIALPSLTELRSMSEMLRPEVRDICRKAFGLEIHDIYSAEEVGHIALQSPASEQLVIQAETILVEVLDEQNRPCAPGEVGRVVVTPLHAFAMPLIRYAIGDFAEAGGAAACGRGLPTLARVVGRVRNMVRLPNGQRHLPSYHYLIEGFSKVIQFQIVRKAEEILEVRLVSRAKLDEAEERELAARIQDRFQYPFTIRFAYVEEIPRTPRGKFIDYLSEID